MSKENHDIGARGLQEIKQVHSIMGDMNDNEKAWAKIILNSYYPMYAPSSFRLFDEAEMKEITKQGQKNLKILTEVCNS